MRLVYGSGSDNDDLKVSAISTNWKGHEYLVRILEAKCHFLGLRNICSMCVSAGVSACVPTNMTYIAYMVRLEYYSLPFRCGRST